MGHVTWDATQEGHHWNVSLGEGWGRYAASELPELVGSHWKGSQELPREGSLHEEW